MSYHFPLWIFHQTSKVCIESCSFTSCFEPAVICKGNADSAVGCCFLLPISSIAYLLYSRMHDDIIELSSCITARLNLIMDRSLAERIRVRKLVDERVKAIVRQLQVWSIHSVFCYVKYTDLSVHLNK